MAIVTITYQCEVRLLEVMAKAKELGASEPQVDDAVLKSIKKLEINPHQVGSHGYFDSIPYWMTRADPTSEICLCLYLTKLLIPGQQIEIKLVWAEVWPIGEAPPEVYFYAPKIS